MRRKNCSKIVLLEVVRLPVWLHTLVVMKLEKL